MQRSDFYYELPEELIARYPQPERSASRLLCLDGSSAQTQHRHFTDLAALLQPGDRLVFNNTQVIPARLYGWKETGGQVEVLLERILDDGTALAHIRASKAPKKGSCLQLANKGGDRSSYWLEVLGRSDALFELAFPIEGAQRVLQQCGHMPLPPYIDRPDESADQERYQTVYALHPGAVAAPTAGLHFDLPLLKALKDRGVDSSYVTLHVGAGTFQPVRVDDLDDHQMHSEWFEVTATTAAEVNQTLSNGGRVVAVGTTSVRCLESAFDGERLAAFCGETAIFIRPGYQFACVDALITNFHLPESTLMMLVSAFAGHESIMAAYSDAVDERYRFFSYGDAMYLQPRAPSRMRQLWTADHD